MKEAEMIELLLQKEEAGMRELLIHYGPLMCYIIAPILPNVQDREDCLSEAVMQVWKNIEKFDSQRGSWNVWLTALTRNYALNCRRNITVNSCAEKIPPELPSPEQDPEQQVIRKERQRTVRLALERRNPKDRILFYRKYYYMQLPAQIASEMGMTKRAVEGKLYRIKKRLRKELGCEG